jgi:hypothetical protein
MAMDWSGQRARGQDCGALIESAPRVDGTVRRPQSAGADVRARGSVVFEAADKGSARVEARIDVYVNVM